MSSSSWVNLEDCLVLKVTAKALLVLWSDTEIWLAKSQVSEGEKYEEGDGLQDGVTISITEWLAQKKNIQT